MRTKYEELQREISDQYAPLQHELVPADRDSRVRLLGRVPDAEAHLRSGGASQEADALPERKVASGLAVYLLDVQSPLKAGGFGR